MATTKRKIGDLGEQIACNYLRQNNYRILSRNFQKPWGEIDIIALKNDLVVFVEVKTRTGSNNYPVIPEQSVHYKKQANLIKTAQTFLQQNKNLLTKTWQIDIIAIELNFKTRKANLKHFPNAVY